MIDISTIIQDYISDEWTEDDPAEASIAFKLDEYDSNDPAIQILIVNGSDKKTWLSRNIYKVEHTSKISIFVQLPHYMPSSVDTYKTTFLNMKKEIDRILNLRFGITGIISVELTGWKDIGMEVGRDATGKTGKEPIVFIAEQTVKTIYYEGVFA